MKDKVAKELEFAVLAFCFNYHDEFGRKWDDILNPSHTNGTFWQRIVPALAEKGMTPDAQDLKYAIKRVYAKLRRGEPFRAMEEMVTFCLVQNDFVVSFTFDTVKLRRMVDRELLFELKDKRAGAIAAELVRQQSAV